MPHRQSAIIIAQALCRTQTACLAPSLLTQLLKIQIVQGHIDTPGIKAHCVQSWHDKSSHLQRRCITKLRIDPALFRGPEDDGNEAATLNEGLLGSESQKHSRISEETDEEGGGILSNSEKKTDSQYRSPFDLAYPETPKQGKFASRVRQAIEAAMVHDRSSMFSRGWGFTIEEVRVQPDLGRAYVLWDALPPAVERVQQELTRRSPTIRRLVAKNLAVKRVPDIQFHHNSNREESSQVERGPLES